MNDNTTQAQTAPQKVPQKPRGGTGRAVRRFILFLFFAAALLGGAAYYAGQIPALRPFVQKIAAPAPVKKLLGWDTSESAAPQTADISNISEIPETSGDSDSHTFESAATPRGTIAKPGVPEKDFAPEDSAPNVFASGENVSPDAEEEQADLAERLAAAEKSVMRLRRAHRKTRRNAAAMRLRIVDLQLRQSGDTAAAAAALSALKDSAGIDNIWLGGEIARIESVPPKNQITETLRELAEAAENAARPQNNAPEILGGLVNALRSRRTDSPPDLRLQKMELLWLTGQREAYAAALDDIVRRPPDGADPNILVLVKRLRELGAPRYAVNFGASP